MQLTVVLSLKVLCASSLYILHIFIQTATHLFWKEFSHTPLDGELDNASTALHFIQTSFGENNYAI